MKKPDFTPIPCDQGGSEWRIIYHVNGERVDGSLRFKTIVEARKFGQWVVNMLLGCIKTGPEGWED